MEQQKTQDTKMSVGMGIVVAGIIIGAAIILSGGLTKESQKLAYSDSVIATSSVNEDDHIFGNPDAEITFIEYSDFQCPYCSRFHPTMEEIVKNNDNVRWVYRHFPLGGHPEAIPAALASECIAELGGNDMFWKFGSYLFDNQASLGDELYAAFARENNLDEGAYATCYEEERYIDKVENDEFLGQISGVSGTPASFVVVGPGQTIPFSGALPYESIQNFIDKINKAK